MAPRLPGPAYRLCRAGDGAELSRAVHRAEGTWDQTRGLLGFDSLPPRAGLWFRGVRMIHTFFMRFPLDVAFVGPDGAVLDLRTRLAPWRIAFCRVPGRADTLETAAGTFEDWNLKTGDRLELTSP